MREDEKAKEKGGRTVDVLGVVSKELMGRKKNGVSDGEA